MRTYVTSGAKIRGTRCFNGKDISLSGIGHADVRAKVIVASGMILYGHIDNEAVILFDKTAFLAFFRGLQQKNCSSLIR